MMRFPAQYKALLLVALFFVSNTRELFSQSPTIDSKNADNLFLHRNYVEAYALYKNLQKNTPTNNTYTYRLGVCALFASEKKEESMAYLESIKNKPNIENELHYFLGKAYMLNYKYDKAIEQFEQYKNNATADALAMYNINRNIEMCENAKKISPNTKEWRAYDKKTIERESFLDLYDSTAFAGTLKIKPNDFFYKTYVDFEVGSNFSTLFMSQDSSKMLVASYGINDEKKNMNIYIIRRLPNMKWGVAEILPETINTEYDEDFPVILPDGKTLYFSSKGHNSMGGYDIFKSVFDSISNKWSKPENLGVPINSPDDDYLFVIDTTGKQATYTTLQNTSADKKVVVYLKKQTPEDSVVFVKGFAADAEKTPIALEMCLVDVEDCSTKAIYKSYRQSGKYFMQLQKGTTYLVKYKSPTMTSRYNIMHVNADTDSNSVEQRLVYDKQQD